MKQLVKNLDMKLASVNVRGLKFFKTRRTFENYKNSCGFDPATGEGHSYGWYSLSKVIKGKLVLNTYNYSSMTVKHISKFCTLFNQLGLTYIKVNAPQGLQNLDVAKNLVINKYARKPWDGHTEAQERLLANARAYRSNL